MYKLTLRDVISYKIRMCSQSIHILKRNAWANRDIPIQTGNSCYVGSDDGVDVIKLSYICPRHPYWYEYLGLKREISIWSTVLEYHDLVKQGISFDTFEFPYKHIKRDLSPSERRYRIHEASVRYTRLLADFDNWDMKHTGRSSDLFTKALNWKLENLKAKERRDMPLFSNLDDEQEKTLSEALINKLNDPTFKRELSEAAESYIHAKMTLGEYISEVAANAIPSREWIEAHKLEKLKPEDQVIAWYSGPGCSVPVDELNK